MLQFVIRKNELGLKDTPISVRAKFILNLASSSFFMKRRCTVQSTGSMGSLTFLRQLVICLLLHARRRLRLLTHHWWSETDRQSPSYIFGSLLEIMLMLASSGWACTTYWSSVKVCQLKGHAALLATEETAGHEMGHPKLYQGCKPLEEN